MKPQDFQHDLLNWFKTHGRKTLPWQQPRTPYRVWISEIMLQQTQVATVIGYFERFMQRFPDVKSLAKAPTEEVLKYWAGLGYYARARNLHCAAQMLMHEFKGEFPADLVALQTLPGVGRSTAGAILSLGFNQPAPILDGNVKRVLTRVHTVAGWPSNTAIQKKLWEIAEQQTPKKQGANYTQAMMDLGALICLPKNPLCGLCPVAHHCKAHQEKTELEYPTPKPRKKLPVKSRYFLLIQNKKNEILLEQRPPVGIWGGLWSVPECAMDEDLKIWCKKQYGFVVNIDREAPSFRHTFSHYHLDITPVIVNLKQMTPVTRETSPQVWCRTSHFKEYGLPTPVKKILGSL